MSRRLPSNVIPGLGTVVDPAHFPEGSAMSMIWAAGKQALAQLERLTSPRESERPINPDPDLLPASVTLGNGDLARVCVFEEPACNAVAARYSEGLLLGVYHGLAFVIPDLVLWIWSDRRFLPEFGDVSRLGTPTSDEDVPPGMRMLGMLAHGKLDAFLESRRSRLHREEMIQLHGRLCPVRRAAMAATTFNAFRWVWQHELAHVLFGHLDVATNSFGLSGLDELSMATRRRTMPKAVLQTFELQADSFAQEFVIGSAFERVVAAARLGMDDRPIPAGEPQTPLSPRQLAICAGVGALMVPIAMHAYGKLSGDADVASSHPPLWFRAFRTLAVAQQLWNEHPSGKGLGTTFGETMHMLDELHPLLSSWLRPLAVGNQLEMNVNEYVDNLQAQYEKAGGIQLVSRRHPSRARR